MIYHSSKSWNSLQEFENEEQNLDKILDEFEQEQINEAQNPKPKVVKPTKNPGSRPRRRRATMVT